MQNIINTIVAFEVERIYVLSCAIRQVVAVLRRKRP